MMFLIILNLKDVDTPRRKQIIFVDPMQRFAMHIGIQQWHWRKAIGHDYL